MAIFSDIYSLSLSHTLSLSFHWSQELLCSLNKIGREILTSAARFNMKRTTYENVIFGDRSNSSMADKLGDQAAWPGCLWTSRKGANYTTTTTTTAHTWHTYVYSIATKLNTLFCNITFVERERPYLSFLSFDRSSLYLFYSPLSRVLVEGKWATTMKVSLSPSSQLAS